MQFSPYEGNRIVSCGAKHIKFWTLSGNTLNGKRGIYGKAGSMQTHLSLAFAEGQVTFSGAKNGDVYKWQGNQLLLVVLGAHKSAINSIHAYFVNTSKQVPTGYVTSMTHPLRVWIIQGH